MDYKTRGHRSVAKGGDTVDHQLNLALPAGGKRSVLHDSWAFGGTGGTGLLDAVAPVASLAATGIVSVEVRRDLALSGRRPGVLTIRVWSMDH